MQIVKRSLLNKVFITTEQIGIIPKATYLYCFKENDEEIWCFSNFEICGTNQIKLSKKMISKLRAA